MTLINDMGPDRAHLFFCGKSSLNCVGIYKTKQRGDIMEAELLFNR